MTFQSNEEEQKNLTAAQYQAKHEAERYKKISDALGSQNPTTIELADRLKSEISNIKLPEILIIGSNGGNSAVSGIDARLLQLLNDKPTDPESKAKE